jgi:TonB family protein
VGTRLAAIGSLALHGLALVGLTLVGRTPRPDPPRERAIEVAILGERAPRSTPTHPLIASYTAVQHRRYAAVPHDRERAAAAPTPASVPAPAEPPPSSEPAQRARGVPGARGVDLFPGALLSTMVEAGPAAAGGHTRRAGDGLPPPGTRDGAADREEAAARARGWLREAVGEAQVAGGMVDPAWRDAERAAAVAYQPRASQITSENVAYTYFKQWQHARPQAGGPTDGAARAIDPSAVKIDDLGMQQFVAAQQALAEPAEWLVTQVDVTVDRDGAVLAIGVAVPSGRRALDRQALDAVRRTLERRPVVDPRGRVTARFAVEAAVIAPPPPVMPVVGPGGAIIGAGADIVGLVTRAARYAKTGDTREVRTRVRLVWVLPVS